MNTTHDDHPDPTVNPLVSEMFGRWEGPDHEH